MNLERSFLIAFFGGYVVNTILSTLVYFIPGALADSRAQFQSPYYWLYVVLSLILIAVFAWWYLKRVPAMNALKAGIVFGIIGFLIIVLTTMWSGVTQYLFSTGSLSGMGAALSNFGSLLVSSQTLVLLIEWLAPAAFVGWWLGRRRAPIPQM